MDHAAYVTAINVVIPDVLDSLDTAAGKCPPSTAATSQASLNGESPPALLISLKNSIEHIKDTLDLDGESIPRHVLQALYDAVECCRVLATVLSPDTYKDASISELRPEKPVLLRKGDEASCIAKRVAESVFFLCEASTM